MHKRDRLEKTLAGQATDRTPVALWRYWPGDDQRSADLARSTIEFQQRYDWDFVKVTADQSYCVADYGLQTEWRGSDSGGRTLIKRPVNRSLEWTELRPLDPRRGELAKHLEAINMICDGLPDVPVIATIYSPLSQARMLGDTTLTIRSMRHQPDRLRTGLNILTESLLAFLDQLRRTRIAGIFYVMDCADFVLMTQDEYGSFGLPYDRKLLDNLPDHWWLNILGLSKHAPMFAFAATYPLPVINWDVTQGHPELSEAQTAYRGTLATGLSSIEHLNMGTPAIIRSSIRDTINHMQGRQLMITSHQPYPVTAPLSNVRAVREAVEGLP